MTLQQAGLKLKQHWPELTQFNLSDEQLATLILNRYPRLYALVSPFAERIKETTEEDFESHRWTEKGRLESTQIFRPPPE